MNQDLLKIIGLFVLILFLLYLIQGALKVHFNVHRNIMEGLTNNGENGIAGSAATYATSISQQATVLQDSLLIKKYKTDYENVIINLDEYIGFAMLELAVQISPSKGMSQENLALINNLNTLNAAKQSLNTVMSMVDQQ